MLFAGNGAPNYDEYTYASGMWTAYAATSPNPGQTTGLNDMTYDYGDNYVLMTQESLDYANYTWALNLTSGAFPTAAPSDGVGDAPERQRAPPGRLHVRRLWRHASGTPTLGRSETEARPPSRHPRTAIPRRECLLPRWS